MRTLNRPMFRYGGPIKEGVMHGIREPAAHGGSMGEPQGKNLVGDSIYPKTDGRAHHAIFGGLGVIAGLTAAARAAMRFGPSVYRGVKAGKYVPGWLKPTGQFRNVGDTLSKSGKKYSDSMGGLGAPLRFKEWATSPYRLGMAIKENPGTALTLGSLTGSGVKMLWPDGTPKTKEEIIATRKQKRGVSGAPGGGDPNMTYTAPPPPPTAAEIEAAEAENRIKQMKKYKEIMDIKGIKKDAVYKSLVDVSKQIQEGGSLKEQLKSGSLISNLTSAASKRFDKVSDTETALRSLVAKGEIENELNKETKALDKEYKQSAININKKKLAGSTLGEELSAYRTKNTKSASGATLKGFIEDKGGEVIAVADTVQVDKHIKGGGDAVSFMESIVVSNLENNKEVTPGIYVVKDTIIQIDENGKVTKVRP